MGNLAHLSNIIDKLNHNPHLFSVTIESQRFQTLTHFLGLDIGEPEIKTEHTLQIYRTSRLGGASHRIKVWESVTEKPLMTKLTRKGRRAYLIDVEVGVLCMILKSETISEYIPECRYALLRYRSSNNG